MPEEAPLSVAVLAVTEGIPKCIQDNYFTAEKIDKSVVVTDAMECVDLQTVVRVMRALNW